jgi:hypothetical protein
MAGSLKNLRPKSYTFCLKNESHHFFVMGLVFLGEKPFICVFLDI